MSWLSFAIASSAVFAITNFVDKYVLEKEISDYRGLVVYTAFVGFFVGIFCWVFTGFPPLLRIDALLIMLSGAMTIWGLALYFRALTLEETSTVIIFMQMSPVITLLLSAVFLQERISLLQGLGFILILASIIGVSLKKWHMQLQSSTALLLVLVADIFWASANTLFKFVVTPATFPQLIGFESLGIGLGGLLLYMFFPVVRNAFHQTTMRARRSAVVLVCINECIFVLAKFLAFFAIALGPVSLVSIVGSTQVFFGIFYGWGLTLLTQKIYHEDISVHGLLKKVFFSIIVFLGIWLIH